MRLTFENYWPLALALFVPWLWRVRRSTVTDLSPKHLQLSTILRSALVGLLVLALMQLQMLIPGCPNPELPTPKILCQPTPDSSPAAVEAARADQTARTQEPGRVPPAARRVLPSRGHGQRCGR